MKNKPELTYSYKIFSVILCMIFLFQQIVWADAEIFQKNTLQPQTLFTYPEKEDTYLILLTSYLGLGLIGIENDPYYKNVPRIRNRVRSIISEIKAVNVSTEEYKNILDKDIKITEDLGILTIDAGNCKIRYFNPRLYPELISERSDEYDILDTKIGKYLARQIITERSIEDITETGKKEKIRNDIAKSGYIGDEKNNEVTALTGRAEKEKADNSINYKKTGSFWVGHYLRSVFQGNFMVRFYVSDILDQIRKCDMLPVEKPSSGQIRELRKKWKDILNAYTWKLYFEKQHAVRVAILSVLIYSRAVAKKNRTFKDIDDLVTSALGHDVGKKDRDIIDLTVKKGRYVEEEKEKMFLHAGRSVDFLENSEIPINEVQKNAIRKHSQGKKPDSQEDMISQIIYTADQIDGRMDKSREHKKRSIGDWDPVRTLLNLKGSFKNGRIVRSVYDAVEELIQEKNETYFRVTTSTYFPWQRQQLISMIRDLDYGRNKETVTNTPSDERMITENNDTGPALYVNPLTGRFESLSGVSDDPLKVSPHEAVNLACRKLIFDKDRSVVNTFFSLFTRTDFQNKPLDNEDPVYRYVNENSGIDKKINVHLLNFWDLRESLEKEGYPLLAFGLLTHAGTNRSYKDKEEGRVKDLNLFIPWHVYMVLEGLMNGKYPVDDAGTILTSWLEHETSHFRQREKDIDKHIDPEISGAARLIYILSKAEMEIIIGNVKEKDPRRFYGLLISIEKNMTDRSYDEAFRDIEKLKEEYPGTYLSHELEGIINEINTAGKMKILKRKARNVAYKKIYRNYSAALDSYNKFMLEIFDSPLGMKRLMAMAGPVSVFDDVFVFLISELGSFKAKNVLESFVEKRSPFYLYHTTFAPICMAFWYLYENNIELGKHGTVALNVLKNTLEGNARWVLLFLKATVPICSIFPAMKEYPSIGRRFISSIFLALAVGELSRYKYENAEKYLEKARGLDIENPVIYSKLVLCYTGMDKKQETFNKIYAMLDKAEKIIGYRSGTLEKARQYAVRMERKIFSYTDKAFELYEENKYDECFVYISKIKSKEIKVGKIPGVLQELLDKVRNLRKLKSRAQRAMARGEYNMAKKAFEGVLDINEKDDDASLQLENIRKIKEEKNNGDRGSFYPAVVNKILKIARTPENVSKKRKRNSVTNLGDKDRSKKKSVYPKQKTVPKKVIFTGEAWGKLEKMEYSVKNTKKTIMRTIKNLAFNDIPGWRLKRLKLSNIDRVEVDRYRIMYTHTKSGDLLILDIDLKEDHTYRDIPDQYPRDFDPDLFIAELRRKKGDGTVEVEVGKNGIFEIIQDNTGTRVTLKAPGADIMDMKEKEYIEEFIRAGTKQPVKTDMDSVVEIIKMHAPELRTNARNPEFGFENIPDKVKFNILFGPNVGEKLGIPRFEGAERPSDLIFVYPEIENGELTLYVTYEFYSGFLENNITAMAEIIDHEYVENILGYPHRFASSRARFFAPDKNSLSPFHEFYLNLLDDKDVTAVFPGIDRNRCSETIRRIYSDNGYDAEKIDFSLEDITEYEDLFYKRLVMKKFAKYERSEAVFSDENGGTVSSISGLGSINEKDLRKRVAGRIVRETFQKARILSIGCGTGIFEECLIKNGCEVTGVEMTPQLAEKSRARGVDVIEADAESASLWEKLQDAAGYNAVIFPESMAYLNAEKVLSMAKEVLLPGGKIFILYRSPDPESYREAEKRFSDALEKNGYQVYASRSFFGGYVKINMISASIYASDRGERSGMSMNDAKIKPKKKVSVETVPFYKKDIHVELPLEYIHEKMVLLLDKIPDVYEKLGDKINPDNLENINVQNYIEALRSVNHIFTDADIDNEKFKKYLSEFYFTMMKEELTINILYAMRTGKENLTDIRGLVNKIENKRLINDTKIEHIVDEIFSKDEQDKISADPIRYAAKTYVRIIRAQAMDNGNHRIADLIANFILMKNGYPYFVLTTDNVVEYYKLLNTLDLQFANSSEEIDLDEIIRFLEKELAKNTDIEMSDSYTGKKQGNAGITEKTFRETSKAESASFEDKVYKRGAMRVEDGKMVEVIIQKAEKKDAEKLLALDGGDYIKYEPGMDILKLYTVKGSEKIIRAAVKFRKIRTEKYGPLIFVSGIAVEKGSREAYSGTLVWRLLREVANYSLRDPECRGRVVVYIAEGTAEKKAEKFQKSLNLFGFEDYYGEVPSSYSDNVMKSYILNVPSSEKFVNSVEEYLTALSQLVVMKKIGEKGIELEMDGRFEEVEQEMRKAFSTLKDFDLEMERMVRENKLLLTDTQRELIKDIVKYSVKKVLKKITGERQTLQYTILYDIQKYMSSQNAINSFIESPGYAEYDGISKKDLKFVRSYSATILHSFNTYFTCLCAMQAKNKSEFFDPHEILRVLKETEKDETRIEDMFRICSEVLNNIVTLLYSKRIWSKEEIVDNAREVSDKLVETVMTASCDEKVYFFIDSELSVNNDEGVRKEIKGLIRDMTKLGSGSLFQKEEHRSLLNNLEIIEISKDNIERIRGHKNVIVLTKEANRQAFLEVRRDITINAIDTETDFRGEKITGDVYIPVLETALFSIGRFIYDRKNRKDGLDNKFLKKCYELIPLASPKNTEELLGLETIKLMIPPSTKFDSEKEYVRVVNEVRETLSKA